jgi:hypothetical protein
LQERNIDGIRCRDRSAFHANISIFWWCGVGWTKKIIECEEKDFLSTFRQAAHREKAAVSKWQFQGKLSHHCSNHVARLHLAHRLPEHAIVRRQRIQQKVCVCSQITRRSLMLD